MLTLDSADFAERMAIIRHTRHGIDSLSTFKTAERLGIAYSGDGSLVHGGTFYDASTWTEDGYADAVRVDIAGGGCREPELLYIQRGQIHRSDVAAALRSSGWKRRPDGSLENESGEELTDPASIVHCEIQACESYAGMVYDYDNSEVFKLIDDEKNGGQIMVCHGRYIPLDNLLGYVVRRHVLGAVIALD